MYKKFDTIFFFLYIILSVSSLFYQSSRFPILKFNPALPDVGNLLDVQRLLIRLITS